jgi:hypothetical protein
MPVSGYFDKNHPDLRMPRTETGTDSLGITYEVPVLSGLLDVKQQLQRQSVSSAQTSTQIREIAPGGASYLEPADYVQPSHDARLTADPLYESQRARFAHPSLADPVLRHHLNLSPLPGAYEERRRCAEHHSRLKESGKIAVR